MSLGLEMVYFDSSYKLGALFGVIMLLLELGRDLVVNMLLGFFSFEVSFVVGLRVFLNMS